MMYHKTQFEQVGIDPATVPPPTQAFIGHCDRNTEQQLTPGTHSIGLKGDEFKTIIVRPLENREVYIANEAYSNNLGWAEGSRAC